MNAHPLTLRKHIEDFENSTVCPYCGSNVFDYYGEFILLSESTWLEQQREYRFLRHGRQQILSTTAVCSWCKTFKRLI